VGWTAKWTLNSLKNEQKREKQYKDLDSEEEELIGKYSDSSDSD